MEFWQIILIAIGVSIPGGALLWLVTGVWARQIVRKRHEKGRSEGKTDEEIATEYLTKWG